MKFSFKVFLCSMVFLAAGFSAGCYIFIAQTFKASLEREITQSVDQSQLVRFSFETAAANAPTKYTQLRNDTIVQIMEGIDKSALFSGVYVRISNDAHETVYESARMDFDPDLYLSSAENCLASSIVSLSGEHYVQTAVKLTVFERSLYLETLRNVSPVFSRRQESFGLFQKLILGLILASSVIMLFLSSWLTKPVKRLSLAAKAIAAGDLSARALPVSADEIGELAEDFNTMAAALEEKVRLLEAEAKKREDFIANFSHEMKTPLTSIIGYADILRSKQLEPEKQFIAANYIFNEGKRLESLSRKLLELFMTGKGSLEKKVIPASALFDEMEFVFAPVFQEKNLHLELTYDNVSLYCEPDLLKSLLINLIDNARKASEAGGRIEVIGQLLSDGYLICVKDEGCGIEKEELERITEAFYMVDKARTRAENGFGLGLALCVEIAGFHSALLDFESEAGAGTAVKFFMKEVVHEG